MNSQKQVTVFWQELLDAPAGIRTDPSWERALSLRARELALHAAAWQLQAPASQIQLKKKESGAPWLPSAPHVGISISHAGRLVACAVAIGAVGVDVEFLRPPTAGALRHFFSASESDAVFGGEPRDRARKEEISRRFTQLWTQKEAVGKYRGTGLTEEHFLRDDLSQWCRCSGVQLWEPVLTDGYCCSVAAQADELQLIRLTANEFP